MAKPPEVCELIHCPRCRRELLHVRRVRFEAPELYEGYQPKRRVCWVCMECGRENELAEVGR